METYFGAQSTTELAWWLNNGSSPSLIGRRRNGSQSGAALGVFGRDLRIDRADLFIDHLYLSIPVTGVFAVGVLFHFFFFRLQRATAWAGRVSIAIGFFFLSRVANARNDPDTLVVGFLLDFNHFCWVLLGFTGFYWVLLGFTGFYWVLPSFTGFYWFFNGF